MLIIRLFLLIAHFTFTLSGLLGRDFTFIENKGQRPAQVAFETDIPQGKLFFEDDGITFYLKATPPGHSDDRDLSLYHLAQAFKLTFLQSSPRVKISGTTASPYYYNYLRGEADKSATGVRGYQSITYSRLFEGIDLIIKATEKGLKYEYHLAPGADPAAIRFSFLENSDVVLLEGALSINTLFGEISDRAPLAWQERGSKKEGVKAGFANVEEQFSFAIGAYDPELPLIIDPDLIFSTYSGSIADNWGYTATYDNEENLYGGGAVFDIGYPVSLGVFDASFNGSSCDVAISKFSANGTNLLYATYLGGNDSEVPHSLVVNDQNQLVILGTTGSNNFPTSSTAFDQTYNGGTNVTVTEVINYSGSDLFIAILSENGTSLIGSTYLGGSSNDGLNTTGSGSLEFNYGDHARGEVVTDAAGNIYIASCTRSNNFPITGGFSGAAKGNLDGLVAKLNPDVSSLTWSSYIGGSGDDAAASIHLGESGDLYVAGGTTSNNFSFSGTGLDQSYNGGQADGFILRINNNGSSMLNGTYLGTNQYDQIYFNQTDKDGFTYVIGQTLGSYPVSPGVYSNPDGKQFIHKLNSTLTATAWSTVFGANGYINISPTAFLVDICKRIYVSGWGGQISFDFNFSSTSGLPITGNALQSSTDGFDMYFIVLDKDAAGLEYGSFFGGSGIQEHVDGGTSRFDSQGRIYQAVCAGCGGSNDFPTTPGAYSTINGTANASLPNCNLACLRIDFQPDLVLASALVNPAANGCAPYNVFFDNGSIGGTQFFWDFGDGGTSTEFEPSHTYTTIGDFDVQLIVSDPNSCNLADTAYTAVHILDIAETITAAFSAAIPAMCQGYNVPFTDLSQYAGPSATYTYIWSFGDGASSFEQNPQHQYATGGTYNVSLTLTGASPCFVQSISTLSITLPDNPTVSAALNTAQDVCLPADLTFYSLYPAQNYEWNISPSGTIPYSTAAEISFSPPASGTYEISLTVIDYNTCNITASVSTSFTAYDSPQALFQLSPDSTHVNVPISFTNASTASSAGATLSYHWDFGDGQSDTTTDAVHTYDLAGTYSICLTTTEEGVGCEDIYCDEVYIDDEYALSLPNAFSPNGDGFNDVYSILGFGLSSIILRIYNRWGDLLFETHDPAIGWDGYFRGKPQPIEVYVFVLTARTPDGLPLKEKGNITLIR